MVAGRALRVGSRTSPLSLAQTEEILAHLRASSPAREFEVVPTTTTGDREKDSPLLELGRGTFAKEIELDLIEGKIDFAVHSAKDLLSTLPEGLTLAAIGRRLDPRDVLVDRWGLGLAALPSEARIGTSSPRRTAQIKALRDDVAVLPIRGNVGTRLEKAVGDDYDGVVVAAAGLIRLGRENAVAEHLPVASFTPEVGQGTLAVEAREDDAATIGMLAKIDHAPSHVALAAERAFLAELGGGCKVPVAAYARIHGGELLISAMAALPDGSQIFRRESVYPVDDPEAAGRRAAEDLLESGAKDIVDGAA